METDAPTRKASPSPSREKSRSRSRSRAVAGGSGKKATTTSSPTSSPPSSPLGPFLSSLTVPQGWFLHFYALGSVAATAVLGAALRGGGAGGGSSSAAPPSPLPPPSVAALALLLLHVLRRWGECAWQASWPAGARMHSIAYAFGMSYYAVLPLSLVPAGACGAAAAAVRGDDATGARGGGVVASFLSKLGIAPSFANSPPPSSLRHPASLVLAAFGSWASPSSRRARCFRPRPTPPSPPCRKRQPPPKRHTWPRGRPTRACSRCARARTTSARSSSIWDSRWWRPEGFLPLRLPP